MSSQRFSHHIQVFLKNQDSVLTQSTGFNAKDLLRTNTLTSLQPFFILLFIWLTTLCSTEIFGFHIGSKNFGRHTTAQPINLSGATFNDVAPGTYKITAKHSGKALDVYHILQDNGTPVVQWDYIGSLNQQWELVSVEDGYYKIIAKHSGKALDATAPFENGTIVHQWEYWGGDNQKWRIELLDDGYYRIISKQNARVLDVSGVSTETGAQIIQYDWHGGDNQRWQLEPVGPTSNNQLSDRVLIVYNAAQSDSVEVAQYYAGKRAIPASNLCAINPSDTYELGWNDYLQQVRDPIENCLNSVGREKILYLVFSYQTPFRLSGVPNSEAWDQFIALDQHIATISATYALFSNPYAAFRMPKENYYQPFQSLADYRNQPSAPIVYSVWRLDAKNVALAKQLVDRALAGEQQGLNGQACLDRNRGQFFLLSTPYSGYLTGDWDLYRAAQFAREKGFDVTEDGNEEEFGTAPAPLRCDNAALYSGWYSLNNYNDAFSWAPGAIGFHLDSASAADPRGGSNWSANAVEKGITVTAGAIAEPYLQYMPHPDGVFRNLFEGANVGDAFLRNVPFLRWRIIQIGDPLYRPFPNSVFPIAQTAVPSPWTSADVGTPAVSGSSGLMSQGTIAVTGGGDQMWYDQDKFHFVFQTLNGDGEIVARVKQCENATWDSRAGVMIRESAAEGSRHISLSNGCGSRVSLMRAETMGGTAGFGWEQNSQRTEWLKLARNDNTITGYYSADGQNWNQFVQRQLNLPSQALIGLFSYADSNAYQNHAIFDQVSVNRFQ